MGILGSFGKQLGGLFGGQRRQPQISMQGEWENSFDQRQPTMQGGMGDRLGSALSMMGDGDADRLKRRQRLMQFMQSFGPPEIY